MLPKSLLFFLSFFILAALLQLVVFKTEQDIIIVLAKTFISGLVAAGVFLIVTKSR